MIDFDAAVKQYIETLLWSELDDDGEPFDKNWKPADVSDGTRAKMAADVRGFIECCQGEWPNVFANIDSEQIGHDFALTRNGHGTGFWDRGNGARGQWLSEKSKPYGETHLYVA